VLILAGFLFITFGGNDDQTAVPDEPDLESEAPPPQPDINSWWETFTDWAAGAWQSIQDFFTGLFENSGNNQAPPPTELEAEEEVEEEPADPELEAEIPADD